MTIKRNTLYQFCKDFVDEYEKCEKNAMDTIIAYKEEGYSDEECREILYDTGRFEAMFNSCNIYQAGLEAFIVDDFVKDLDETLQMHIIRNCMSIMTSK